MKQMIRPVISQLFESGNSDPSLWIGFLLCLAAVLTAAVIVSLLTARYASKRFEGNQRKVTLCFIGAAFLAAVALMCFFGCAAVTVRGIIFTVIITLSSYEDIKTRECDDYLHVMIAVAALIGTEPSAFPGMLLSGVLTGSMMLIPLILTKSKTGGADIKFAAACSFMLGVSRGITGLLIGMITALLFNIFRKNKKEGFPMIPYLAVGYMAAYFI